MPQYGKLKIDQFLYNDSGTDVTLNLADIVGKSSPTFTGTINAVNLILSNDLTVNGTTTTINTTTLQVEDKNIEIGKVSSPSDATADGGGLTLLGATNKTWNWVNSTDAWTSSEHIHLPDNKKLYLGTGSDLRIYHDGSTNIIDAATSNAISFRRGGSEQFFIGNAEFKGGDNKKIKLGTGDDLQIYHNGDWNYIDNIGSKNFVIRVKGTENAFVAIPDGSTQLYYDGSKKLETSSTGGILRGTMWTAVDNTKVAFGNGDDLQIYHNGSDSIIHNATGNLTLRGSYIQLNNAANTEAMLSAAENGAVSLYYDNAKKFETTSTGIEVTGNVIPTGYMKLNDNQILYIGSSNDLQIYHDGSNTYLVNSTGNLFNRSTGNIYLQVNGGSNENAIVAKTNGAVELYYDNSKKLETTSGGVNVVGALTVNGAALSAAPEVTAVAYGTIGANAAVIVRSDGKVSTITGVSAGFTAQANTGAALDFSGGYSDNCHYLTADFNSANNKICAAWYEDRGQQKLYGIVGTVSGTSITWGSKITIYNGQSSAGIGCCWAATDKFIVAYDRTNTCKARYISVSGTSLTLNSGGEAGIIGYNGSRFNLCSTSNNGRVLMVYQNGQTGKVHFAQPYINGTNVTVNDFGQLDGQACQYAKVCYVASKNTGIITYQSTGGTYNGRGVVTLVGTANGSYNVRNSNQAYLNGGHNNDIQFPIPVWDEDKDRFLVQYANDVSGNPRSCEIGQITGSGNSVIPVMSGTRLDCGGDEVSGDGNLYYDSYKKKIISAFRQTSDSIFNYREITINSDLATVTVSGATAISATGGLWENSWDIALAALNIGTAKWLFLYGLDNTPSSQNYVKKRLLDFGSTDMTTGNFVGFANAGYSDGNTATISVTGNTSTQSGLTTGQLYYVTASGGLSTTEGDPSVKAGIALSSTKLLIRQ